MLKSLLGAIMCAALLTGGAFAQIQVPQGQIRPNQTLPQGTPRPGPIVTPPCNVDLAVTSVTLTRGTVPGQFSVTYEIRNLGTSEWRSGANQQQTTLRVHNNNTGANFDMSRGIATRGSAGARVALVRSGPIANAFDTHEFGGNVLIGIVFEPDILSDGNACNDDANAANNTFNISNEQVWGFVGGGQHSQVFRR